MLFVAEVKTSSPFGYRSDRSFDELFEIANNHGDIISIHTNPRWGGSFDLLVQARRRTNKPILAKGLHPDLSHVKKARECGADYVLTVGWICNDLNCWFEPLKLAQIPVDRPDIVVVWNSRDLLSGIPKKETFEQARTRHQGRLVQASLIRTVADVKKDAEIILVGEHLETFIKSRIEHGYETIRNKVAQPV